MLAVRIPCGRVSPKLVQINICRKTKMLPYWPRCRSSVGRGYVSQQALTYKCAAPWSGWDRKAGSWQGNRIRDRQPPGPRREPWACEPWGLAPRVSWVAPLRRLRLWLIPFWLIPLSACPARFCLQAYPSRTLSSHSHPSHRTRPCPCRSRSA